jgi:hypothetical protein
MLENINTKINGLSTFAQNQLSFNKMIETKLAQIAASIPINNEGKIPGQPKNSFEKVNVVTTRGGKSTRDPQTLTTKQEKHKGDKRKDPYQQRKPKKILKKWWKRHRRTSSTPPTCRFPQEKESKLWMSNLLVSWI